MRECAALKVLESCKSGIDLLVFKIPYSEYVLDLKYT